MTPRKRVILHIGLPKTGTTTLQWFCLENAALLGESGLLYPDPATFPNYRAAPKPAWREVNHTALLYACIKDTLQRSHVLEGDKSHLWPTVLQGFAEAPQQTLILSHENFSVSYRYIDFERLQRDLADFDVQVVVYLRRLDDWAASLHAQRIRGSTKADRPFEEHATAQRPFSYFRMLNQFQSGLPGSRLSIRVLEEVGRQGGLVRDFLEQVVPGFYDSARPRFVGEERRANSSLHPYQSLFLQELRRRTGDEALIGRVMAAFRRRDKDRATPDILAGARMMERETAERFLARYSEDRVRIARKYGVELPYEDSWLAEYDGTSSRLSAEQWAQVCEDLSGTLNGPQLARIRAATPPPDA